MNKIIIDGPGKYLTREGKEVEIVKPSVYAPYHWMTQTTKGSTCHYMNSGHFYESLISSQRDIISKAPTWHNPAGVTQEQLEPEKGWRLLTVEERIVPMDAQFWYFGIWLVGYSRGTDRMDGNSNTTYRTKAPLPAQTINTENTTESKVMKNQAVFVHIGVNPDLLDLIQAHTSEAGIIWKSGEKTRNDIVIDNALSICLRGNVLGYANTEGFYADEGVKELSIPEFLAHIKTLKAVKVKLNDKYTAEIKDGKVAVGCQEFSFESILELAERVKETQGK